MYSNTSEIGGWKNEIRYGLESIYLSLTKVVEHDGKQMVKVISWYDNEMGYSAQMVRTAKKLLSL